MNFSHAANTDGLAEVDVASDGCSSGVEPSKYVSRNGQRIVERIIGRRMQGTEDGGMYQSIDCGGSSLEGEVLTVSTQPKRREPGQNDPYLNE